MLWVTGRLRVKPEKADTFARMCETLSAIAQQEPGTIGYDYYVVDDGLCLVHECYADEAAIMAHFGNIGEAAQAGADSCAVEQLDICGDISPALRGIYESFRAPPVGADVRFYKRLLKNSPPGREAPR